MLHPIMKLNINKYIFYTHTHREREREREFERERREHKIQQDKQAAANDISFTVNGAELERVKAFVYLGRVLR